MTRITPALRTIPEQEAHAEFMASHKQPNDYRILAARLALIAKMCVIPRPDLLEEVKMYKQIANSIEAMKDESEM